MSDEEEREEGANPSDCIVMDDAEEGVAFAPFDDFQESFDPGPIKKVLGSDGLPTQHAPFTGSDVPPLSTETLTCMADESEHVIRDEMGRIMARSSKTPKIMPNGMRFLDRDDLEWTERVPERLVPPSKELLLQFGHSVLEEDGRTLVLVEPIRAQCKHYARQFTQLDLNPENKALFRLCTARRSMGGAFMDLSNLAMFSCELRDPPDAKSLASADEFDRKKILQGKNREFLPIFEPARDPDPEVVSAQQEFSARSES